MSSISRIVVPFAIAAYVILLVKIYNDNKGDLKTSHVFLINLIITFLLCMIEILIEPFLGEKKNQDKTCNSHFLSLLIRIFLNSDLLILQIDRFVSVWKPYLHRSIASPKFAVKIVLVSKVPSIIVASAGVMAYPSYLTCSYSPLCRLTHFLSVTLVSYPLILTTILTCIVSIFITVTLAKLNKVNPAPGSFPFVINVSHANLTPRPTANSEDDVDIAVEEFIATMYNQQPSQRPPTVEIPNQDKLKTLKLGITMNLLTCLFLLLLPLDVVVVQSKILKRLNNQHLPTICMFIGVWC